MQQKSKQRIFSMILAGALLLGITPMAAAEDQSDPALGQSTPEVAATGGMVPLSIQLEKPTNLSWEQNIGPSGNYWAVFDKPTNIQPEDTYLIQVFKNGVFAGDSSFSTSTQGVTMDATTGKVNLVSAFMGTDGIYTFRVQVVTGDSEARLSSEFSDYSPSLVVGAPDVRDLSYGPVSILPSDGDVVITGSYTASNFGSGDSRVIEVQAGHTGSITLMDIDIDVTLRNNIGPYDAVGSIYFFDTGTGSNRQLTLIGENRVRQKNSGGVFPVTFEGTDLSGEGHLKIEYDKTGDSILLSSAVVDTNITAAGIQFSGSDNRIVGGRIRATENGISLNGYRYDQNHIGDLTIDGGDIIAQGEGYGISIAYADLTINAPATFLHNGIYSNQAAMDLYNEANVVINAEVRAEGNLRGVMLGKHSNMQITSDGVLYATALGSWESYRRAGYGVYIESYTGGAQGVANLIVDGELYATGADGAVGGYGIGMSGMTDESGAIRLHVGSTGTLVAQGGSTQTESAPGIGIDSYKGDDHYVSLTRDSGSSVLAYPGTGSDPAYNCAHVQSAGNNTYVYIQITGFADNDGGKPGTDPEPDIFIVSFNSNGGSTVANQSVKQGEKMIRPANPTRSGYTFGGWFRDSALRNAWDFDTDVVTENMTLYASWTYNGSSGGSSGGSSSSGGGGSSSGGTSISDQQRAANAGGGSTFRTTNTSSNVSADGSVIDSAIRSELNDAIAASAESTVTVRTRGAESISTSTLKTLAAAAQAAGRSALLHADTMSTNSASVQGRLYVEPARLTSLTNELRLGVYTEDNKVSSVKNLFQKYYSNSLAVIAFDQQGPLGARLQVAAKIDLSGMDRTGLVFYSYDRSANQFTRITNPDFFIDESGYLHFYTDLGGYIIVSNGMLQK